MIKKHDTRAALRGTALLYVLAVIATAAVLFAGLVQFVLSHVRYDRGLTPDIQALHVAEAGVYFYRWYLAHNVDGLPADQVAAFWRSNPLGVDADGDGACSDAEAYEAEYEGIGTYRICITPPKRYSTVLWITSEGTATAGGVTRTHTVRARLRKKSWSEYAILANADMRLSEGTKINGKIHVNGGIQFDGVAHNTVSSSEETYINTDRDAGDSGKCVKRGSRWQCPAVWTKWPREYNNTLKDNVFRAGKKLRAEKKDFNGVTGDFALIAEEAQRQGLKFDGRGPGYAIKGYLVELGAPSPRQMRVTPVLVADAEPPPNVSFPGFVHSPLAIVALSPNAIVKDIPDDGVVYVDDDAWVQGVLPHDTRLTIASSRRILLGRDDLTYATRDGSCVLGLMAVENIELIKDSEGILGYPESHDLGTLHIDAALLSQDGRVGRPFWQNNRKNTINIHGAIATNKRMGFGYTDHTGFAKRLINFDANLLNESPPLFPTGTTYAIDLWESL